MSPSTRVALVKWAEEDGLTDAIHLELVQLGFEVTRFLFNEQIPEATQLIFSFGPFDRWMQVIKQAARRKTQADIRVIHWNTENPPDLRIPWQVQSSLGKLRSAFDRLNDSPHASTRRLVNSSPFSYFDRKMNKFRYIGEYLFAFDNGWLDRLAASSTIYSDLFTRNGLPTQYVPWGTSPQWYADLDLIRDIDVIWFGKRRSKRRDRLLRQITRVLRAENKQVYIADNIEHPFIYDEERTRFLNRASITLNVLPTWYDNAFPYRFHVAAGNRSLVVSENTLAHSPEYRPGVHYVAAPPDKLVDAIRYYLSHPDEREQIVENAYRLVTEEMTLHNSVRSLVQCD